MSGVILLILRFLMVAALYAFLGWALHFLWNDLKKQRETIAAHQMPTLGIMLHSQDGDQKKEYKGFELLIGRAAACEITLQSDMISAQHAALKYRQNQWWLEDMNSTNGTFLNQDQVKVPIVVADGDHIRCGDISFTLSLA